MVVMQEFARVSCWVKYWLAQDEECRNNDRLLIYRIMRCTTDIRISYDEFKKIPNFETVRRVRQKLQESGKFLPTKESVVKRREIRREEIRVWARSDIP